MATPYDINSTIQSYLNAYSGQPGGQPGNAQSLAAGPAEANLGNAQNLQSLSSLVNNINQQAQQTANISRTGYNPAFDQQQLQNIYNLSAGNVSPETTREAEAAAAQQWGGGGFGVDTPAWQSAVRRTLGLQREDLQKQGAAQYGDYLQTHQAAPLYDIKEALVTPQLYQSELENRRNQALQLAKMQSDAATAQMNARAALAEKLFSSTGGDRGRMTGSFLYPSETVGGNRTWFGANISPNDTDYRAMQERQNQDYAKNMERFLNSIMGGGTSNWGTGSYPAGY